MSDNMRDGAGQREEERRQELYQLLGDLPSPSESINVRLIKKEERASYIVERLELDLNGIEPVPAYFVRPKDGEGPFPAILYNHAHGGNYSMGKDELLRGLDSLQKPAYADVLTSMGYAILCIDAWAFGERQGRTEGEIFKQMLWSGQVMWGMMVYDSMRAIDYLVSRDDVDSKRIGTLGMSMGSTMAWWVAALDTRIQVCVDICCLTDFQALIESRGLDGHGVYYFVPGLLKRFSTAEINALIAPRAHLSVAGAFDRLTPVSGLQRVDAELKEVYAAYQASDAWNLRMYPCGHKETAAMRADIQDFLQRWLSQPEV